MLQPHAEVVLAHARQVVSLTGDLAKWAQRTKDADEGFIRVGMIDIAATQHFPAELKNFRAQHPNLNFLLRVGPSRPLLEMLERGELDLVVCVDPEKTFTGIATQPLFDEELAIAQAHLEFLEELVYYRQYIPMKQEFHLIVRQDYVHLQQQ